MSEHLQEMRVPDVISGSQPVDVADKPSPSADLLAKREIMWSRGTAELRGNCDYCKATKVLLSYNQHGLWNCFTCFTKMDIPANAPALASGDSQKQVVDKEDKKQ